jgi:hypothetical protein
MQLARQKSVEVRHALHQRGLYLFPSEQRRAGQVPVWESSFEGEYARGVLQGDWRVHGRWRFWSDPTTGEALLQESSVGVTVHSHQQAAMPIPACVARYDVELHGQNRGRHINVMQPVLGDQLHWLYMDQRSQFDDWALELLLDFLLMTLPNELLAAGWPDA